MPRAYSGASYRSPTQSSKLFTSEGCSSCRRRRFLKTRMTPARVDGSRNHRHRRACRLLEPARLDRSVFLAQLDERKSATRDLPPRWWGMSTPRTRRQWPPRSVAVCAAKRVHRIIEASQSPTDEAPSSLASMSSSLPKDDRRRHYSNEAHAARTLAFFRNQRGLASHSSRRK